MLRQNKNADDRAGQPRFGRAKFACGMKKENACLLVKRDEDLEIESLVTRHPVSNHHRITTYAGSATAAIQQLVPAAPQINVFLNGALRAHSRLHYLRRRDRRLRPFWLSNVRTSVARLVAYGRDALLRASAEHGTH